MSLPVTRLYLEDLHVGQVFHSRDYPLSQAQIIEFAQAFDPQSYHLDPVAAEQSFFEGLAASGWHTAAITGRLVVESVLLEPGVIGAGVEIKWNEPTRPGDVLRVISTITQIRPLRSKPDRAIVTLESRTLNQDDAVKQTLISSLVAFHRPD